MEGSFNVPTLSLEKVLTTLQKENLLKEYIVDNQWQFAPNMAPDLTVAKLAYDSREVQSETLFFCKGFNFEEKYLVQAVENGAAIYLAETTYENIDAIGVIVTDIRQAMAKISQLFYDFPEKKLTTVAITGTKGKTTTSFFAHGVLDAAFPGKVGLSSTESICLDGKNFEKAHLSTPESLDLFAMLAKALSNGLTHFVIEVSSQAYKLDRVFGMTFDYGIFLNISTDHISPTEHPTFDDYFYWKRQLLVHCQTLILNHDSDFYPLILQTAQHSAKNIYTFGFSSEADLQVIPQKKATEFQLIARKNALAEATGTYALHFPGDFNFANAAAALTVASLLKVPRTLTGPALEKITVPGRMMVFHKKNGGVIFVDYAHNYTSLENMVTYLQHTYPGFEIGLLIGAPGDRAFSRRGDFGRIITKYMDVAILTEEDSTKGDVREINNDIKKEIQKELPLYELLDRTDAVWKACELTGPTTAMIIAGKGTERTQRRLEGTLDYEGDDAIVERYLTQE